MSFGSFGGIIKPTYAICSNVPYDILTAVELGFYDTNLYPINKNPPSIRIGLSKTAVKKWGTDGPELEVRVDRVLRYKEDNNGQRFCNLRWFDKDRTYKYRIIFARNMYGQLICNLVNDRGPEATKRFKVFQGGHGEIIHA